MASCRIKIEKQGKTETKVLEGDRFSFGRAMDCSVVLNDDSISRKHLEMAIRKGRVYLKDLGSSNGTYLNGKRMKAEEIREYVQGDFIRVGNSDYSIQIEYKSEAPEIPETPAVIPATKPAPASKFPFSLSPSAVANAPKAAPASLNITPPPVTAHFQESKEQLHRAQESASEILKKAHEEARKVSSHAEEAARATTAQIHQEARTAFENAQIKAKKELEEARSQAEELKAQAEAEIVKAKAQGSSIIEEAKKTAEEIEKSSQSFVHEAKETANQVLNLKKQEAEEEKQENLKKWERQHKTLLQDIEKLVEQFEGKKARISELSLSEKEIESQLKTKKSDLSACEKKHTEATALLQEEEKKFDQVQARLQGLERQIEEQKKNKEKLLIEIKGLESKSKIDSENLEKEFVQKKERVLVQMAELRQKELNDIQKLRLDELDNLDKLRRQAVDDIQKNQNHFIKGLSEKLEARMLKWGKVSGVSIPADLRQETDELVLQSFNEQIFEMGQGFEKDIRTQVKVETAQRQKSLKKFGAYSAAVAVAIVGLFVFQGGSLKNVIQGIDEAGRTAAEQYSRQMVEQRAGNKFEPVMSSDLKATYADNVLYTQGYLEMAQNSDIREKWIKLLNKFLTRELALEDDSVVQLVAAESTLISRLKTEREQINPEYIDVSVQKMQKLEAESVKRIRQIFKTTKQFDRYNKVARDFWTQELQKMPASDRLPANK